MNTTTIRLYLHEFARGCVLLFIFGMLGLGLIAVNAKSDTQEAETERNTARLKSLGLLPDQPIRVIERESQPPTFLSESMGVPAEVARVAGQGGARP